MFRGITSISIDIKGRVAIPTRYRSLLSEDCKSAVVITIDTEEKCLLLYTALKWQLIEENLQQLPSFNAAARRIQRLLIGHATDVDMDNNGRILIPPVLRDYAHLEKEVLLIGQGNKFEVWNKELWESRREEWLAEEGSGAIMLPDEMKTFSL